MHTLAFDASTGASGDMVLGALLDAGADPDVLTPVEAALDVEYEVGERTTAGIAATDVTVGRPDGSSLEGRDAGRAYGEVVDLIEGMDLPRSVREGALTVVELLGAAEAAVHGTDIGAVHFHEVGADDAVADVVGAALLVDDLDPDRIVTTPPAAGGGETSFSHGTYPVPTPAVVEIASRADWSLRQGPVDVELLTPTGAAILAGYADGRERLPTIDVDETGYGVGDRDLDERPNVLRALIGGADGGLARDEIAVLETNLDDAAPELLGDLQESLAEAGARDVSVLPATMKKSRPGHHVKVICDPDDAERVARRLVAETGTLGVREVGSVHRWIAHREVRSVDVEVDGESFAVGVKIATDDDGGVVDISAEYDDAAAVARDADVPTREVMRRAEAAVRES